MTILLLTLAMIYVQYRFMAIASNFVLNGIAEKHAYRIYPWVSK